MLPAFQFQPLARERREIRLITLSPRGPSEIEKIEVVRCSIKHASLDDQDDYVALSYTWGDPNNTLPILVDGATLPVTVNLAGALQQFQPAAGEPSITMWVDAVCIYSYRTAMKRLENLRLNYASVFRGFFILSRGGKTHAPCFQDVIHYPRSVLYLLSFSFRKGSEAALIGHVTERWGEAEQGGERRGSAGEARPSTGRARRSAALMPIRRKLS
jgi:hypothetical protein